MLIIGIAGKAGSGKDTVAGFLEGYGIKPMQLAKPVKDACRIIFHLTDEQVYDPVLKEQPLPQWDNWTPRQLMQRMGTEASRDTFFKDIWVRSLLMALDKLGDVKGVSVSDCRFANEVAAVKKRGGLIWYVERPGAEASSSPDHVSEQVEEIKDDADLVLVNDGTLSDLEGLVHSAINEVMKGVEVAKV